MFYTRFAIAGNKSHSTRGPQTLPAVSHCYLPSSTTMC